MSATLTNSKRWYDGKKHRHWLGTITLDASYPTGGYPITIADLGFTSYIEDVIVTGDYGIGFVYQWNKIGGALQAFFPRPSQASDLAATVTVTSGTGDGDANTYAASFSGEHGTVDRALLAEVPGTDGACNGVVLDIEIRGY